MSTNTTVGLESSDTDRRTDLPTSAYRLGIDNADREHYHDPLTQHIWVFRDGECTHETDLDGRSVVEWVLFIDEKLEGWTERHPVEESGGLGSIVDDIVDDIAEQVDR